MVEAGVKVEFDNDWLEEYQLENVVISSVTPNIGAVVASKDQEALYSVHIFRLNLNHDSRSAYISGEIASFEFLSDFDRQIFTQTFPDVCDGFIVFSRPRRRTGI